MSANGAGTIERVFAAAEADAAATLKTANTVAIALKKYHSAARAGKIRDMNTIATQLKQLIKTLDQEVANLVESREFDEKSYLESGGYSAELISHAQNAGLQMTEGDGRLYCYPALLRILPEDRSVKIDKKTERSLRPSVMVALLSKLQKQPARFNVARFLEALYQAYEIAIDRRESRHAGSVVSLGELYRLFTLLPGASSDYSQQEFARDIYLLDQSRQVETKTGARLEFHIGSGAKTPAGAMSIVTQSGVERKYHGISFVTAQGSADVH